MTIASEAQTRPRIHALTPSLINQIAAGEVVERPASVVKELLENALDAGSTRVTLELEAGGLRLIRITDDGNGVVKDDLRLAVQSHATSKLRRTEDLFAIRSLGFRGEALASIAAVSKFTITSRPPEEPDGAQLVVDGGAIGRVRTVGAPLGTQIEVGDLFFNVPARRGFLRTERSELRAILNEVRQQALCRPDLTIRVEHEGKTVLEAVAEDEPRERIAQLLGRDLAEALIALPLTEGAAGKLRGYVSPCDLSRGDSRQQFFFLNGRAVRDVTLLTAIKTAYSNLLPPRRHPTALLWLDLPPAEVDVNVHPQKTEVRFRRDRELFRLVQRTIADVLREEGLTREFHLNRRGLDVLGPRPAEPVELRVAGSRELGLVPSPFAQNVGFAGGDAPPPSAPEQQAFVEASGRFLQVHDSYVVEQTPRGIRLLDPHALHERILYEEIRERLERDGLESQRFLFPQLIDVGPVELAALEDAQGELVRLGFEVTPFGEGTLAVHAAPRMLKATRVQDTVKRLLSEEVNLHDEEPGGLLHQLAATLACRSAVRFGEPLSDDQIRALLARRDSVERGHCCPHGRPTTLTLTLDELGRRFRRQSDG
ncbi:MAG: DNA mismatch repair endonuclease MutL [Planctomycetota bacterium]